jgi:hypothetical protein
VNGADTELVTTFISPTQLTAVVPADLLTATVSAEVRVEVWDKQGNSPEARSDPANFSVATSSAPYISSISPGSAEAGGTDLPLTIFGTNFVSQNGYRTSVAWNGPGGLSYLTVDVLDNGRIDTVIPASLLTTAGTATLNVQFWHKADDEPKAQSNTASFNIAE